MIKCFCPSCGNEIPIEIFVPSKVKFECSICKQILVVSAREKEIVIKFPIYKTYVNQNAVIGAM